MSSSRRIVLGALALGGLVVAVTVASGQSGSHPPGIDVSHWQGTINWTSVKNSGVVFALTKATEGTTYTDPSFATNWAAMKAKGIVRGAYHFGRPGTDAVAQARYFVNVVKPTTGDLQLCLDLETTDGKTAAQVWAWTQAFCNEIQSLTHRPGIIYCSPSFWSSSVGNPTNNLNCALWIANWGVTSPTIPHAWTTWTFWQYSATGTTPGVSGNCDVDYFNGTTTNLQNMTFPRDPLNRK